MSLKKAVFFDRDDTIIIDKVYLNDPNQIEYFDDALVSLKKLADAGFLLFVVSNQSGITRGLVQESNLHAIHEKMQNDFLKMGFQFTHYYYCPHLPESNHRDRKPNPGMLLQAQKDYGVDLSNSWMVGDRYSDVEAGIRAGTKTILLKAIPSRHKDPGGEPNFVAKSLTEATDFILKHSK